VDGDPHLHDKYDRVAFLDNVEHLGSRVGIV
jgi:hypothetical protein